MRIVRHVLKHKCLGTPRFAMVLQLEPLHTCNLNCTGCGRIREYSTSLKDIMSLEDCLASARECDAPMVSICGGEPLIYPQIKELVAGLLAQHRIVYICTNGLLMRRELKHYLSSIPSSDRKNVLARLLAENLISEEDIQLIQNWNPGHRPPIKPSKWLYWNVHIDGSEYTHDLSVQREGVFRESVEAIKMAKILGFQVATNTTVYRETDMKELEQMFEFFSALGLDGHTISPGYDFDAAKSCIANGSGKSENDFFLTRAMTRKKFAGIRQWSSRFNIFGTPVYQEFLEGTRELTCTPWAVPTRNVRGWKAPCYLITDAHFATHRDMLEKVDWTKYGVVDGITRDPRCENCMVHSGYDPSGALGTNYRRGDNWKNLKYNFSPRPRPVHASPELAERVFNGVSVGKGHLSGATTAARNALNA